MTTAPAKKSLGSMAIVGVLTIILLVGTLMFGYFGYQLLVRKPAAAAPKGTPGAVAEGSNRTATPARTGVVIVAATSVPGASGTEKTATPGGATPTATRKVRATAAPGSSGGTSSGGNLPQTGLGLGTPVFGLLLAGLATAARRLRRQC